MNILALKETAVRGNFDFPVGAYRVDEKHPRYVMPTHWHEEYEMIRIVRGSFQYAIGRERGVAQPGDLLFVNSGEFHGGVPKDSQYHCVVFNSLLLEKDENSAGGKTLAAFHRGERSVCCQLPARDGDLPLIFDRLFQLLLDAPRGFELQVQGLLYQFFGIITQNGYYERKDGGHSKKWIAQLKEAISLIESEYSEPLTLASLAQSAGMSEKYFCRFFKQMTRYSPIEYLNRHRIEVACYRLMSGTQSVTDIAYDCGFNDLSYFIRMFKQIVGMTPKQYALLHRR